MSMLPNITTILAILITLGIGGISWLAWRRPAIVAGDRVWVYRYTRPHERGPAGTPQRRSGRVAAGVVCHVGLRGVVIRTGDQMQFISFRAGRFERAADGIVMIILVNPIGACATPEEE
ncbi:MAG: hypothetical protein EI684_03480, partial [Candidatus Viridilinea halotolerans]